ncbi:tripartite motif-containing protein 16-like [Archocentrus centrarchus]|uniref:tripartite motif-containing protein 16-like n=1 Tax=Archocentrus centrarchus TaxID=63155 RepID=UPI0011E9FB48|nr:tripartite motif-containing protein 16-like [Archocentrus centrarchus]
MVQRENQLDRDKLCCSVCLDLLRDPVTLPCGHNYCMNCMKSYWDGEDQKQSHSCPQCRQSFTPRPALVINTVIAGLVEDTEKTGLQAVPADLCPAEHGEVTYDFCTERKLKAIKSCLQCLVSYCEQHLQPHYESPAFKKHKLVDPSQKLQEIICSRHSEVMKIFCRTDQQCICYLCSMDEHKGHETVSAAAAMSEKQRELGESQQKIQQRIQEGQKHLKVLQEQVENINQSTDKVERDSKEIFTEVKQQIRSRQKSAVSHVNELQEKLQQKISELSRRNTELEQLSHTEDPTQFLHNYTLLPRLGEATDSPSISIDPQRSTEDVTAAASEGKDKLQNLLSEEWTKTSLRETAGGAWLSQPEPKTRAEFLKYKCQITFNLNTAHQHIKHVHSLKVENSSTKDDGYHDHPDRFTDWSQVLCRESLAARCYWEVEWSGNDVFIAVAHKDISRSGIESAFGNNNKSWAMECFYGGYEFRYNNIRTPVSGPRSSRIGVYLDHSAGVLSFYSICETTKTMTLLHRVQTRFSEPVCPGFSLYCPKASAKIPEDSEGQKIQKIQKIKIQKTKVIPSPQQPCFPSDWGQPRATPLPYSNTHRTFFH